MKKLVLILALLFSFVGAFAEGSLNIRTKSGDVVSIKYAEQPEIKFNGTKMTITTATSDQPVVIELSDIDGIEPQKNSGIGAVADNLLTIMSDAAGVHFSGVPEDAALLVAGVDGRVWVNTVVKDGEYHLYAADFAKGIYIVKINQFTTKVIF